MNGVEVARIAKEQLSQLTGLTAETVSKLECIDGKWHVAVDMIELERIPRSSDVLAVYEIVLDETGNMLSYKRTRRYYRGEVIRER